MVRSHRNAIPAKIDTDTPPFRGSEALNRSERSEHRRRAPASRAPPAPTYAPSSRPGCDHCCCRGICARTVVAAGVFASQCPRGQVGLVDNASGAAGPRDVDVLPELQPRFFRQLAVAGKPLVLATLSGVLQAAAFRGSALPHRRRYRIARSPPRCRTPEGEEDGLKPPIVRPCRRQRPRGAQQ